MTLRTYVIASVKGPFHFHTADNGQSLYCKGKKMKFKIQILVLFLKYLSILQSKKLQKMVIDSREQLNLILWAVP